MEDLEALRVSALIGTITMRSLHVTVNRNDAGMLNSYGSSALPVPEPSSFLLLGFLGILLRGMGHNVWLIK
jgi:hypothetical protein